MAKRILIADDSVTIQKAFAMTFAAEDITLMPARSADEGLSLARQMRPDLVIADGFMPGRSGYDLCAAIKAEPTLRGTLVYILSSTQQPYDEARGRQIGADGHFIKPFETGAMIEKVRDVIARAVPAPIDSPGRGATPLGRPPLRSAPPPDDDYGEISVDLPSPARDPIRPSAPAYAAPAMRPAAMAPSSMSASPASGAAASASPSAGAAAGAPGAPAMRPSLIPGLRPGAIPAARPGAVPAARPSAPSGLPGQAGPGAAPPAQRAPAGRTLMGLPAANIPIPGSSRPGAPATTAHPGAMPQARPSMLAPSRPAPLPSPSTSPSPSLPSAHQPPAASAPVSSALGSAVGATVDAKIAAFAAKGPEYEAIAKLSREVIEQIVWEIVPELAETIIREHLEKRGRI